MRGCDDPPRVDEDAAAPVAEVAVGLKTEVDGHLEEKEPKTPGVFMVINHAQNFILTASARNNTKKRR